nr:hypothetical protein [Angustibacter aerolatus]
MGAVADLLDDLLGACPRLRVVATSREPSGSTASSLFPLTPLRLPEPDAGLESLRDNPSVRLLLDRAAAVGSGLALDERTAAPVVEIVRRLDGLPLAIEPRGGQVARDGRRRGGRPPRRPVPAADRRAAHGGAAAPHAACRGGVEPGSLLAPVEREVAERFCVFNTGAGPEAVAAVCPTWAAPDAPEVTDVLQALVEKSVLVADRTPSGTRFRMLETLREFGSERLAERGEARRGAAGARPLVPPAGAPGGRRAAHPRAGAVAGGARHRARRPAGRSRLARCGARRRWCAGPGRRPRLVLGGAGERPGRRALAAVRRRGRGRRPVPARQAAADRAGPDRDG